VRIEIDGRGAPDTIERLNWIKHHDPVGKYPMGMVLLGHTAMVAEKLCHDGATVTVVYRLSLMTREHKG